MFAPTVDNLATDDFSDVDALAGRRERSGYGTTTIVPSLEEAYRAFDMTPIFR